MVLLPLMTVRGCGTGVRRVMRGYLMQPIHARRFYATAETPSVSKAEGRHVTTTVDDRVEDGVKIHEEKKTTKGDDGTMETTHKVVTDEDDDEKHIHTEKVETTRTAPGEEHKRFDKKVVETGPGIRSETVVHEQSYVHSE
eukprot:TRINITY_DN4_c0_g2_i4.p1 TRINITY_DN4_c0_g2~~TRINITY_DN4_c0_g2_i4.p1  ORF type:complete len:141 (+),score=44.53 TRINITY_DN4_c0_g2_i4:64-486(+)